MPDQPRPWGPRAWLLGGFIPREAHSLVWRTWWLGDVAGVLVFTPLLLVWLRRPPVRRDPGMLAEAAAFAGLLSATSLAIFGGWLPAGASATYLAFPILIWAAFRFGRRGTTAAICFVAAMASLGHGTGVRPIPGRNDPD